MQIFTIDMHAAVYLLWRAVFGFCDLGPLFIAKPGGECAEIEASLFDFARAAAVASSIAARLVC
jgi:hypothetical protein